MEQHIVDNVDGHFEQIVFLSLQNLIGLEEEKLESHREFYEHGRNVQVYLLNLLH